MTPELQAAADASWERIRNYILQEFPTAVFLKFYRESDWGEWHNYSPEVFDGDGKRLDYDTLDYDGNPINYEQQIMQNTNDDWLDLFPEAVGKDWEVFCNITYEYDSGNYTIELTPQETTV